MKEHEYLGASYIQTLTISMNWLCRFGIHRWSLWTDVLDRNTNWIESMGYIQRFQHRCCINCHKIQENILR